MTAIMLYYFAVKRTTSFNYRIRDSVVTNFDVTPISCVILQLKRQLLLTTQ